MTKNTFLLVMCPDSASFRGFLSACLMTLLLVHRMLAITFRASFTAPVAVLSHFPRLRILEILTVSTRLMRPLLRLLIILSNQITRMNCLNPYYSYFKMLPQSDFHILRRYSLLSGLPRSAPFNSSIL